MAAKPTKKFTSRFLVEVEVEVAVDLLEAVMAPDWQGTFYRFDDEQQAADHLAYNLGQGRKLAMLDGFADRKPADATILSTWLPAED